MLTFGAQFAEVAVDPELGLVRVRRLVGAFAPGRVLNPMLARSQLMSGMLWGMSQALLEANHMDPRHGRWAASNLAEYLVPVNADAPDVTVEFVEVHDELAGPLGRQGCRRDRAGRHRGGDRQRGVPRDGPPRSASCRWRPSW